MTLKQALGQARGVFAMAGIEDASLEAELLLRHTLAIDRVKLYQDLDGQLTPERAAAFRELVERRGKGEPSAYITGHREFYGLDFHVDPRVLIPRPESEMLVEKARQLAQDGTIASIADVGTGCGAIAICLALSLPSAKFYATDISAAALEVARRNCQRHGLGERIVLLAGDLLDPLPEPVDLIIANLPYVRESELPPFEPRLALDGGWDGLDQIRRLCPQLEDRLCPRGSLLLEMGQGQGPTIVGLLRGLFSTARIGVIPDLSGIDRVIHLDLS